MPRNVFRVAQGRGVAPTATSLATMIDLEDLCGFELAAAKKNAQTLATVTEESSSQDGEVTLPSAFDKDTDFESMTDAEIQEAVKAAEAVAQPTMSLDRVASAGVIYQVLPENYKMNLLDTKHPNANVMEFINWLATKASAPFGLSKQFATNQPTGADYRANQLFSERALKEAQKFLEGINDWVMYRWAIWANKKGHISIDPTAFIDKVDWAWPSLEELDENAHEQANAQKLRNLTGSYKDILGPDWKSKLETVREEIDWCKSNNLPHPAFNLISGGERHESFDKPTSEEGN